MNDLPLRPAADIGAVEDRFFTLRNFPLTDGTVMLEREALQRALPPGGSGVPSLAQHANRSRKVSNDDLLSLVRVAERARALSLKVRMDKLAGEALPDRPHP